ncbi:MAG TPA: VOC family protein [Vitreimonas sp.]|uniref:VOC family protein n=1 Tax=Vitreimonas sp. TaxID=3069702 RepID=UPI002D37ADFF|nr:VOC family protein [Vitreimonas sp.]HYD88345.1 VOC family protein [Vitreimonas sp.]
MAEPTSAIPVGVYPYLKVKGGKAALDFYARAFGATEEFRNYAQDGERIMHARFRVNGGAILLSDDFPEFRGGVESPPPDGVTIHLEVDDADRWWKRAVDAGAEIVMPLADQFWGDRYGQVKDPFGHMWSIGSPVKK